MKTPLDGGSIEILHSIVSQMMVSRKGTLSKMNENKSIRFFSDI